MNLIARLSAALVLLSLALPSHAQLYPEEYTVIHERHSGTFVYNWEVFELTFSPAQPFHIEAQTAPYINGETMITILTFWQDGALIMVDDNNVSNAQHIKALNLPPGEYTLALSYGGYDYFADSYPSNGPQSFRLSDRFMFDRDDYQHFRRPLFSRERGDWALDMVVTLVPEPTTYAMLLAGLGVAGVAIRRRRRA